MYNRDLTEAKIASTAKELNQPLHRYSGEYITAVVEHLQSLAVLDDKGRLKELHRPLKADESQFIRNERLMCALDYDHWSSNYHRIRDSNTQEMIPFNRNAAQDVLNQVYCEMEAAEVPIMLQSLKARQLGVTTDTTSRIQHRALFIPNTSGVLASSDEDKTWKLSEMNQRSLRLQPWWLIPEDLKSYVSGEVFLESPTRNMTIGIQHGRQTTGISRGDTINCWHLSEIPDFDPKQVDSLINASLMKAMHPTSMTFGVLESSANGRNDFWHKRWRENQQNYGRGRSLERPVFLPWFIGVDIYPTKGWLKGVPVPNEWTPPQFVIDHAEKCREYVLANKLLYTVLGLDWRMPLEQMWFYVVEYERALEDGEASLAKFYSEMPANDLEAFQSKHGQVFSIPLLQTYQDKTREPVGIYAIKGDQVPSTLWPEATELAVTKPEIPIVYTDTYTGKQLRWSLVPVVATKGDGLDRLIIWELPVKGAEYGVGLDGAEGKGLDRTVLPVVKKGNPGAAPVQVAELATDKVATLEIWPVWLMLLRLYSPIFQGEYTYALAAPEMNKGGDAALMQVRQWNWPNFYVRHQLDTLQRPIGTKLGWETTPKTRDQLVQWVLMLVKGHWAELNSVWLIDELRDLVVNQLQTKVRIEAGYGSHDDRIFALVILILCLQGIDVNQAETPQWRRVMEDASQMLAFPVTRGLLLPVDNQPFTSGVEVFYSEEAEEAEEGEVDYA